MKSRTTAGWISARLAIAGLALTLGVGAGGGDGAGASAPRVPGPAPAAAPAGDMGLNAEGLTRQAAKIVQAVTAWHRRTPPGDRVTWGGLAAAAALGLGVALERSIKLRGKRVIPDEFTHRFLERMLDGKLDRGKALDFCELNPSPSSRVALAAVRRWGRPVADMERAVSLAHRVEADRLRRNVGTLRRVAALSPLIGLLGSLVAVGRVLDDLGPASTAVAWGPALATALWPVTAGVAIATIAIVLFDGLASRVETLVNALDRIGAETLDAVAMALPLEPTTRIGSGPVLTVPPSAPMPPPRAAGGVRLEVPNPKPKRSSRRPLDDEDDY